MILSMSMSLKKNYITTVTTTKLRLNLIQIIQIFCCCITLGECQFDPFSDGDIAFVEPGDFSLQFGDPDSVSEITITSTDDGLPGPIPGDVGIFKYLKIIINFIN